MPFSFPASPSVGATSTQNGRQYVYAGNNVWELVAASVGGSGLSWSSVPASATATGTAGQIAYDNANGFLYVATATDSWKRAALSTWPLDPQFANVLALLHADGNLTDSSSYGRTLTANGDAASNGTAKFGSASLAINGGNISIPNAANLDLGDTWTVEAWVYVPTFGQDGGLACRGDYTNSSGWDGCQFAIRLGGNAAVTTYFWGSGSSQQIVDAQNVLTEATWAHVAAVRDGTNGRVYVNGSQVGSTSGLNSPVSSTYPIVVGKWTAARSGSIGLAGLIDEFRVTKSARYSANFTPNTTAFPNA
jgi:hypothetical protein